MAVYALGEAIPDIHPTAMVHPDAVVIGAVMLGPLASVWPSAVLRADYGHIEIGELTSVQDGTVVHTTEQSPTIVGARCVVGHNAHIEGCTIGDDCLIGSGSVVLNRAVVESRAGVAAAAPARHRDHVHRCRPRHRRAAGKRHMSLVDVH